MSSDERVAQILARDYKPALGARSIENAILDKLIAPLADYWEKLPVRSEVKFTAQDEQITKL